MLIGLPEYGAGTDEYFNSVIAFGASPQQVYRKHHLVPFGEFVPLKGLFGWFVEAVAIPLLDFSRGGLGQRPLAVAGQKVGVNICYEDLFGEEIIRQLPEATMLVNVSNVAWFGDSLAPAQHLQISQMRALETGRPMLRATNTGMTAVIDPQGPHRGDRRALHRGHRARRRARLQRRDTLRSLGQRRHAHALRGPARGGARPSPRPAAPVARRPALTKQVPFPGRRGAGRIAASLPSAFTAMLTFQQIILRLQEFWDQQGCALLQPYDMEMGAGTFHTATFLRAIGPEPWRAAYVQPSRRPKDGRYGENPNRLQHYYQYQVVLKPSPPDIQDLYLRSLEVLGIDPRQNDIRFVEDDWESPTLGAWGLGWEVWLNGMEVTQFTYFQEVGSLACKPVLGEITYGLERLAMYLQGVENVFDLVWTDGLTYRDVYHQNEVEQSIYNFEKSNVPLLFRQFNEYEAEAKRLIEDGLALPGYEMVLKCSHTFNLLDARGAISVTERAAYIGRVRALARLVAQAYYDSREALGFPMCAPVAAAA